MKIVVINGTEKQGVTFRLKELFLQRFQDADIVEYYLPKDVRLFVWAARGAFLKAKTNVKTLLT